MVRTQACSNWGVEAWTNLLPFGLVTIKRTQGKWGETATPQQAAAIVTKTASFQVVYMTVLVKLAKAVQTCKNNKVALQDLSSNKEWDEAIALLVGSLEGSKEGGSLDLDDGELFWNLANEHAVQFQTSNDAGYSLINEEMEDLFYAGRAEGKDCRALEESANQILHLMFLPLIQATLRYAILNQGLSSSSSKESLALGEVYSLAVLPLVSIYDENSAQFIGENMVIRSGAPVVPNGPQQVANAFYEALRTKFGYSCALVGSTSEADACELEGGFATVKPKFDQRYDESGASQIRKKLLIPVTSTIIIAVSALFIL
mmetsp:Transcript_18199/g.27571  ORF Transcript_18199/g.27571 Transcript_18199/m.27571 type:complete len:316 (-) Transcript_18199:855-1802(-)